MFMFVMRFLLSSPAVSQLPFEGELYYSDIVSSTSLLIMEWSRDDLRDHPVPTTMPWTGTLSVSSSKLLINLLTCISTNNNCRVLLLSLANKWSNLKQSGLQFCLPRRVLSLSNHPSGLSLLMCVLQGLVPGASGHSRYVASYPLSCVTRPFITVAIQIYQM